MAERSGLQDNKAKESDFEANRRFAADSAEYLQNNHASLFTCGSEQELFCLEPASKSDSFGQRLCFAWTGKTAEDLKFWDMRHDYSEDGFAAEVARTSEDEMDELEQRRYAESFLRQELGLPKGTDIPTQHGLYTTIKDIAAIFAEAPMGGYIDHQDKSLGIKLADKKGVAVFRQRDNFVYEIPNTNVCLAYFAHHTERNGRELADFANEVEYTKYKPGKKPDWNPPPDDKMTMEEREEKMKDRWYGIILFTIANTFPEWHSLFPSIPRDASAVVLGKRVWYRETHGKFKEENKFYSLEYQQEVGAVPFDPEPAQAHADSSSEVQRAGGTLSIAYRLKR